MRAVRTWQYSMVCSLAIILLGVLELVGVWSVPKDSVLFGVGVMITGGVMLAASILGYIEAMMDEVQQILDNIQQDMYMFLDRKEE